MLFNWTNTTTLKKEVDAVLRQLGNHLKVRHNVPFSVPGDPFSPHIDFVIETDSEIIFLEVTSMNHPRFSDFSDLAKIIRLNVESGTSQIQGKRARYVLASRNPQEGEYLLNPNRIGSEIAAEIELVSIPELSNIIKSIAA